ncbi:peptidylprolyl isomerase [Oricola cellulosilytica]|uniref:Parvulin-like PPIase n=1 Tax=Oricola cellulosilytica TaxID=1429082 RepID=A0A4V2MNK6_9HYPH|nr:peptidylprolyl isomerase [Oricola cellulosilytica]TCD13196.1 peptidylprolyl isomerase [Oricola cellulosilytica]
MLDSLRKSSRSWVAKALLLLLLVSFAVWGVSGQILSGGTGDAVVTAGETKVSGLDYRLAYDRQLAIYSRQLGERITREQARLFGIDRQVLGQMVAGAVLDEQSREMNLGLSKDRLATLVAEDEAFQGVNGQFSRENFRQVLRNVGMTEDGYIKSREEVAVRQQVIEAVADGIAVPATMLEAIAQHTGETRDVQYVTVGEQAIEPVTAPDDATLKSYFEENKERYRAPEYRTINYVRLTPAEIVEDVTIDDDQLRADYEARKSRYATAETRTIEQLVFADEASATAARQRILAGESFEDAVAEAGRTMEDVSLGTLEKSDLPDQAVAEAAFAIESAGGISEIIDGAFGPILLRVTEINPASVQRFEDVRDEIRRELALVEANDTLLDIHDAYEDARAGGQTMEEAASSQRLTMETIRMTDAEGRNESGAPITSIEEQAELIAAAFEAETGLENPPINAGQTGFVWYEVEDITPERDRSFEEVRDRVTADWIAEETDRQVREVAEAYAERFVAGEELAEIAEAEGLSLQSKFGLQRTADDADFGNRGVAEVFDGGPEHSGVSAAPTGTAYNVFKVTGITQPLGGPEALTPQMRENLAAALSDDLLDQMVAKLQTVYPVGVDQRAIERALATQ